MLEVLNKAPSRLESYLFLSEAGLARGTLTTQPRGGQASTCCSRRCWGCWGCRSRMPASLPAQGRAGVQALLAPSR